MRVTYYLIDNDDAISICISPVSDIFWQNIKLLYYIFILTVMQFNNKQ
jgi:hypothetical protein